MKVLVTGAGGYIGGNVATALKKQGHDVIELLRKVDPANDNENCGILLGDLTQHAIYDEIRSLRLDAIIHTVSLDHTASEFEKTVRVNETNVLPVWRLLAENHTELKKFIYLSTIQVLGKIEGKTIDEKHQRRSTNIYGLTHAIGEDIVSFYNRRQGAHCMSLRLSNGYGSPSTAGANCWSLVVNDLCRMAIRSKRIVLQSDGSAVRDFIHVNDISDGIVAVLNSDSNHDVYNLCSGNTVSLLDIAKFVRDQYYQRYGSLLPIYHSGNIEWQGEDIVISKYHISNDRLSSEGFSPTTDIHDGINDLFEYLENHAY